MHKKNLKNNNKETTKKISVYPLPRLRKKKPRVF